MSNLIEKTSTVTTTAIFNKNGTERFLLKSTWDHRKTSAVILMSAPSSADELIMDQTTMLCHNGAVKNDFGSLAIVNLTSSLYGDDPKTSKQNKEVILQECEKADCVLVCFGRGTAFQEEKEAMLKELLPFKSKLYTIIDRKGLPFAHPLSPLAHEFIIQRLDVE